jgi:hypothetical protein
VASWLSRRLRRGAWYKWVTQVLQEAGGLGTKMQRSHSRTGYAKPNGFFHLKWKFSKTGSQAAGRARVVTLCETRR